ncbi:MAG: heparin lyase I family protein [Candidatus Bathyarchaeota archaeon]|nr:MAG: heparin lyase I family protein [Candidatus Bathyarchaeota archaeon]
MELGWIDDIPSLNNESDIAVLGNVQETPRYNTSGEAWVDGVQVDFAFYDATLVDRFIINCTREKAINMSTYAWVEWTAPILEGTIYEGELPPPAEDFDLFFEYGAETGIWQPPLSTHTDINPQYYPEYLKIRVVSSSPTPRSGTQSLRLDNERYTYYLEHGSYMTGGHSEVHKSISLSTTEFYVSFWVYIPSSDIGYPSGSWAINIFKMWERRDNNDNQYGGIGNLQISLAIDVRTPTQFITGGLRHQEFDSGGSLVVSETYGAWGSSSTTPFTQFDQWVRFQMYVKRSTGSIGEVKWWVGDSLLYEYTGKTSYGDVSTLTYQGAHFNCYMGTTQTHDFWVAFDDIVIANSYVPLDYRVDKS